MKFILEWDRTKAHSNLAKHKISFEEAETVFDDPFLVTFPDELHSEKEDRLISIGICKHERLLVVVHVEKLETRDSITIRIISCRKATLSERRRYEEGE
jgi:uncharacterized DUF497 family protein